MLLTEPFPTAVLLATFGLLMAVAVLFSRALERLGVPILLLFLVLGMLGGSEGIGGVWFEDYSFTFRIGAVALVLILFDGGLNTPWSAVRACIGPASVLATAGVAATAALTAVGAVLLDVPWQQALLLGAVVSSTDAAAVFAVLRGSRLNLQRRVGVTLELESGMNDPMAVILTTALTESAVSGQAPGWGLIWEVPVQLGVGLLVGWAAGVGGVALLKRIRLRAGGLFPVLTLGLSLLAFGAATLVHGSGFLAVYVSAIVIGNATVPYRNGLRRIHDAMAWLGQISMFLILGLLVFPSRLLHAAPTGIGLGIFLAVVARPLSVLLCLLPFRFRWRDTAYIGWAGLRGAVPIILATIPVLSHVPGSKEVFDIVFFVVVVNAILPGATLRWVTRRLGLEAEEPPDPAVVLEINSSQLLNGEILSFFIDPSLAVSGVPIARIKFPDGTSVILVVRDQELIAPRGDTVLTPGDHVFVFCRAEARPFLYLLFGQSEEE